MPPASSLRHSTDGKPSKTGSGTGVSPAPVALVVPDTKVTSAWEEKGSVEGVSSSSVAVDVESADVRAERERVAGLTSLEQQCIVMHDLRKIYPAQVSTNCVAS